MGTMKSHESREPASGQSLVEFALVVSVLLLVLLGLIQLGAAIATKHQLVQVGRDVGRWAATQAFDPCNSAEASDALRTQADSLAQRSALFGYGAGTFQSSGVDASWQIDSGVCPPIDNTDVAWVTIRLSHRVPVLVPLLPAIVVDTTAQFRMEPPPTT